MQIFLFILLVVRIFFLCYQYITGARNSCTCCYPFIRVFGHQSSYLTGIEIMQFSPKQGIDLFLLYIFLTIFKLLIKTKMVCNTVKRLSLHNV